jgi:hypothetical protein
VSDVFIAFERSRLLPGASRSGSYACFSKAQSSNERIALEDRRWLYPDRKVRDFIIEAAGRKPSKRNARSAYGFEALSDAKTTHLFVARLRPQIIPANSGKWVFLPCPYAVKLAAAQPARQWV